TIGGARQRLSSAEVSDEGSQFKQLIRQMVVELEDVVKLLRS
ncbi:MAG TPA: MerR family transcriptional regulator, partial [Pseudomonas sp.]|nr:MerR family transcriptional regulator [Pseudomonas sp.]